MHPLRIKYSLCKYFGALAYKRRPIERAAASYGEKHLHGKRSLLPVASRRTDMPVGGGDVGAAIALN